MTDKIVKAGKKIKISWNDTVIAESSSCYLVEGNYYFPVSDVRKEYLKNSDLKTFCPWKGKAEYYSLVINGEENQNAAWYYPEPKDEAVALKGYISFWNVDINEG